ncbi:hypothetical protein ACWKT3_00865 [Streptomyces violaceus]
MRLPVDRRVAQGEVIEGKREHREPPKPQEPESKPGQIVDLMAALNESVQQATASRGEDADVHETEEEDHEEGRGQEDVRAPAAQRLVL